MKVGMLECDHVSDSLKNVYGDYSQMFENLFPDINFRNYDVIEGQFPDAVDECEAYLVTGSKHSVYDDIPWIHQLKQFVQQIYAQEKYYIGICFGHQMLAEALGGHVGKSENGWCVGMHSFQLVKKEEWMEPYQDKMNLLMSCQDQVQRMPDNSTLLAESIDCQVGMFKVGECMLGIQGHPEFQKDYNRALIESRVDRIATAKVKESFDSLKLHHDGDIFVQWVMNFLEKCHIST